MIKIKTICFAMALLSASALTACGSKSPSNQPDLLTVSEHCNNAADFGECLLSSYVNHPASMAFPEELRFSPYYGRITQAGYDREKRRKSVNRYAKNAYAKERNTRKFKLNDMYFYARAKTPEGTAKARAFIEEDERPGVREYDPAIQQWFRDSSIFDDEFTHTLLDKYSSAWMQKSAVWDQSGMAPGQSPFEILGRAYEKIGDSESAAKMASDLRRQKFHPLREKLMPVYTGKTKLTKLNGEDLKEVGFYPGAIDPLIDHQIANGTRPTMILSNLAFALRYGHGDRPGNDIAERALKYAFDKNDAAAIKKFADQTLSVKEDFSNGLTVLLKRADRLSQDLVLIRYLSALNDQRRINKIAAKWDPLLSPLPDGKMPILTATGSFDYTKILHHAGRAPDVKKLMEAWDGKLFRMDNDAEFITSLSSQAVTIKKVKALVEQAPDPQANNRLQRFYIKCADEGGLASNKYKVRNYCISQIRSPAARVRGTLKLATIMYEDGESERGRELTKQALSLASDCTCVEERPFSDQSYYLADIILAELQQ
ncbi:hypothetical protein N9M10_02030 [Hellea sp.]|nr:hypothetical protein [Hellea sp.]